MVYHNHRLPPELNGAAHGRSNRLLDRIAPTNTHYSNNDANYRGPEGNSTKDARANRIGVRIGPEPDRRRHDDEE